MEIEAEVEVFEMKQEIVSLQAKLDDAGGKFIRRIQHLILIFFLFQSAWCLRKLWAKDGETL